MDISQFDYDLPRELIAQNPAVPRDHSRLMIYNSSKDLIEHRYFYNLPDYLKAGDVLVVNRSKVIPARVTFDGKEVFILKDLGKGLYHCMVRPGRKFFQGSKFMLGADVLTVVKVLEDGTRELKFGGGDLLALGNTPLPPYITQSKADTSQYQTIYARESGSVAAPTAGLHFTEALLESIKAQGVQIVETVLHVGRGTFLPVTVSRIEDHVMHEEFFELSEAAAKSLNLAKKEGRRIIAVGTTSVRVLESCFAEGKFDAKRAATKIFIYPGYEWRTIDGLITNFHLPKSTLLMLVQSFLKSKKASSEILDLYEIAIEEKYRFYSFGDAMFLF